MSIRVAQAPEDATKRACKAALACTLRFSSHVVQDKQRVAALPGLEHGIDEGRSILSAASAASELVSQALRGLQHSVKIVVVVNLGHAVVQQPSVCTAIYEADS